MKDIVDKYKIMSNNKEIIWYPRRNGFQQIFNKGHWNKRETHKPKDRPKVGKVERFIDKASQVEDRKKGSNLYRIQDPE